VAMALAAGEDIKGQRDRALLLIGFAGAFRRSELRWGTRGSTRRSPS
jgi:hypothetical protein